MVLTIRFTPKNFNPIIMSGMLNKPYNIPTGRAINEFTIVAMPITPPGAISLGAVKQCSPSEKINEADIIIKMSLIH